MQWPVTCYITIIRNQHPLQLPLLIRDQPQVTARAEHKTSSTHGNLHDMCRQYNYVEVDVECR